MIFGLTAVIVARYCRKFRNTTSLALPFGLCSRIRTAAVSPAQSSRGTGSNAKQATSASRTVDQIALNLRLLRRLFIRLVLLGLAGGLKWLHFQLRVHACRIAFWDFLMRPFGVEIRFGDPRIGQR